METTDLEVVYPSSDAIPPEGSPKIDIIFVHGLNPRGDLHHSDHTWSAENGVMWPRDLLPKKIPNARIMIFKYNSSVAWGVSEAGIRQHAETLLDLVQGKRYDTGTTSLPIILIGHSLGGLVIKQALIISKQNDRVYNSFRICTKAIAFFATPHRGGNGTTLGQIAVNAVTFFSGSRNDLVESLKKDSKYLAQLSADFAHQYEDYNFLSVVETRGMLKTPIRTVVVDASSSIIGLAGHREQVVSLDRDHRQICKFAEGPDFNRVARHLKGFADSAVQGAVLSDQPTIIQNQTFLNPNISHSAPTKLKVFSTLDFIPPEEFTGQESILENLELFIDNVNDHYFLLNGKPGTGKSSIAREFASRYQETLSIIWLSAENSDALQNSLKRTAHRLKTEEFSTSKAQNDQLLVHDWLCCAATGKWLVIVDDAYSCLDLRGLLPSRSESMGKILITSRHTDIKVSQGLIIKEIPPMLSHDALNIFLLRRKQLSAAIQPPLSSIIQDLRDSPLAIVLATSCVGSIPLNSAATHLQILREERVQSGGDLNPKIWQWFSNLMMELSPIELSLICLLAMFDSTQLSDEFLDIIQFGLDSNSVVITRRQFKPALQRIVSVQLLHRRSDQWTQYHYTRPTIRDCLLHYLSLHEVQAKNVADIGSSLLHALFEGRDFQSITTSKHVLTVVYPHCRAFCLLLQRYSISPLSSLDIIFSRLSCYCIDQGLFEILTQCRRQFWRTWLSTNNFPLPPEDYGGEEDHALYIESAIVPTWVLQDEDSAGPIVDEQTYETLYSNFWEDLSTCFSCAAIGQSWHGIREDIFEFARELPSAPSDSAHLGMITNSIDSGGCTGLQAAVVQAIHDDAFKTELMSTRGKETIKEISNLVWDNLFSGSSDISSEILREIVSNALKGFTWSSFHALGPSFKNILRGTPKTAVCNVIEPAMGGSADPENIKTVTSFMMSTFSGTPFRDCSKRLARGYWEVVGGMTSLFGSSILNQLSFKLFRPRGPSPIDEDEDDLASQRSQSDNLNTRSLELIREVVMHLLSKQSPAWGLAVKNTAYWCVQAEACRNGWADSSSHAYRNQEIWEESCILLEMKQDCWPMS